MSEQSTGVMGVLKSGLVKTQKGPIPQGVEGLDVSQEAPFSGLLKEQISALNKSPERGLETLTHAAPTLPQGNSLPLPLESLAQATSFVAAVLKSPVGQATEKVPVPQTVPIADTLAVPSQSGLVVEERATPEQPDALTRVASELLTKTVEVSQTRSAVPMPTAEVTQTHSAVPTPTAAVAVAQIQTVSPPIAGEVAPRGDGVQTIQTPVGAPGWNQEFSTRVNWLVKQNISVAEIRLNPPELGPIAVKISVDGGETQIHFSAQHAQSRELLEQASFRLRESLMDDGFSSVNVEVDDGQMGSFGDEREAGVVTEDDLFPVEDESSPEPVLVEAKQGLIDKYV